MAALFNCAVCDVNVSCSTGPLFLFKLHCFKLQSFRILRNFCFQLRSVPTSSGGKGKQRCYFETSESRETACLSDGQTAAAAASILRRSRILRESSATTTHNKHTSINTNNNGSASVALTLPAAPKSSRQKETIKNSDCF